MLKRPNTTKMRRLLMQLIECDPRNAKQIRELQQDTREVLGVADTGGARSNGAKVKKSR